MSAILDLSKPLDVGAVRYVVQRMTLGSPAEITEAQAILTQFKELPDAFLHVAPLLEPSIDHYTRYFALQVLESAVLTRWNVFDEAQKAEIRNFVIRLIVQECSTLNRMRASKALLTKMNTTLVSIAKREWPQRWPTFVSDVVSSCPLEDPMTENNLHILKILGEEVFEFGERTMTSKWIARKKEALQEDMRLIYGAVTRVLGIADSVLLGTALSVLDTYIPWFPVEVVFDPQLLQYLCQYGVSTVAIRVVSVRCLTSIFSVEVPASLELQACLACVAAFRSAVSQCVSILPTTHGSVEDRIRVLHDRGTDDDRTFVDVIVLMIHQMFKRYGRKAQLLSDDVVGTCLDVMVGATFIDDKELFKSCVEFWWYLGDQLVRGSKEANQAVEAVLENHKRAFSNARCALIRRMAKPEEIIIVEEDGELRREYMTDVETLQLYSLMRDALIFLTTLDPWDTRNIMIKLMAKQLDRSEWSWTNCSHLSWAVGAIAGSMNIEDEKDLFVHILRDLLSLCSDMQGKENRAVIASNIMYVTGRYPRFLEKHSSFVHTVCRKLFEFMKETFPGVQDMAVDTFLKLCALVPRVIAEARPSNGGPPFIAYVTENWMNIISSLSTAQMHTTFKAVGHLIHSMKDFRETQVEVLRTILAAPNSTLASLVQLAETDIVATKTVDFMRSLIGSLRCSSNVASSCGTCFIVMMNELFPVLKSLYEGYSIEVNRIASQIGGGNAIMAHDARLMRLVKKEILKILEVFIENTVETEYVAHTCMPPILSLVLVDYQSSSAVAKEPGALALVTACTKRLGPLISQNIAAICDHTFDCTVAIIASNMEDYPELRVQLFRMIQAMNESCFDAFLAYVSVKEDVINGLLWALKHSENTMMIVGLETMLAFLQRVRSSAVAYAFFEKYLQRILTEVMVSAMDSLHAAGFPLHCKILMELFSVSSLADLDAPIVGPNSVMRFLIDSLAVVETLTVQQKEQFVQQCYRYSCEEHAFRVLFADFLIEVQVWGAEQENQLIEQEERSRREQMVPGLRPTESVPYYRADAGRGSSSLDPTI